MLVSVGDREYTSWHIQDEAGNIIITNHTSRTDVEKYIHPLDNRLFHGDIISMNNDKQISIIESKTRSESYIAGVLLLENNKTYGRTENKKKLLYRCIPDNKRLPAFLIPYEMSVGFLKQFTNKYIVFKFHHWNDKHPRGIITETIGDVSDLSSYYEYRLYCKNLHLSITSFTKKVHYTQLTNTEDEKINCIINNPKYCIEDREHRRIISIDPQGSLDIDDAIGIEPIISDVQTGWIVSIYIANVYIWMEELTLWEHLSSRVSTIYLPDGKRSMLPKTLSENLCSLIQNKRRIAFTIDIPIDMDGQIDHSKIRFLNTSISVSRNYAYEDHSLINKEGVYKLLFPLTQRMNPHVANSHELVEHWMLYMNVLTGQTMANLKCGIFRKMALIDDGISVDINATDDVSRVLRLWNNVRGGYVKYSETDNIQHQLINTSINRIGFDHPYYVHITSPIRRLVDILNQVIITHSLRLCQDMSNSANDFLDKWLDAMDTINIHMKSIRKVQHECELLSKCVMDESVQANLHPGYIIDCKQSEDNGLYKYTVYLADLKLFGRVRANKLCDKYSKQQFAIYLFHDSDTIVQKIRIQFAVL